FEATRQYLSKNAFVMTKTQDQQLGYALDSRWYGLPEFAGSMRAELAALTVDRVNDAIRAHLSGENLSVVMVASDAEALKVTLASGAFSAITYDGARPPELLAEDQLIGALELGIAAESIFVTPVENVFA
ncbi:MAG: insulinase family protein, partial [Tepidiformaceae bacterium]